jgi:hypothetical protein
MRSGKEAVALHSPYSYRQDGLLPSYRHALAGLARTCGVIRASLPKAGWEPGKTRFKKIIVNF